MIRECAGVALVGVALLAAVALATHAAADPGADPGGAVDRAGLLGALVAAVLLRGLGHGAVVLVGATAVIGGRLILGKPLPGLLSRFSVASLLLLVSVASLGPVLHGAFPDRIGPVDGGSIGNLLARHEAWLVGSWGSLLLNAVLLVIACLGATRISSGAALSAVGIGVGWVGAALAAGLMAIATALMEAQRGVRRAVWSLAAGVRRGFGSVAVWRERRARRSRLAAARDEALEGSVPEGEKVAPSSLLEAARVPFRRRAGSDPAIVDHRESVAALRKERQEAFHFDESGSSGPFRLPDPSEIFDKSKQIRTYDRDSLIMNSRILEKKLKDFGVSGHVATVHPGPVITMFEFEPGAGIKVNKIVGLADDLALALRALSVRVIAPLPGKSVVGIEVANQQRETVYIRDVLEAEELRSTPSKLTIALGKDIFGNPAFADLTKMPHLLVAGSTGTGKSVFLNSLLCSILCRATPDELRLLLIDPKLLELSIYEGIPHLLADVVTNPKRASAALAGVVRKMEERYQMMSALGVRSIAQFNARVAKELAAGKKTFRLRPKPGEEEGTELAFEHLPFIVVVIDELADLMVVSAKDVEEALQRLAQMARAAGIHLVLATQRPSVDVLTGVIKANFPARISFQVSSRTDSRTILDQNGADYLLGQGDMLFLPPGTSKLQRMHGAFVSEQEVAKLVQALAEQGAPVFDDELIHVEEEGDIGAGRDADVDEMFDRAVAIVTDSRNASISYLQRRLKVGYNRAARMIEQMENEGMIGPQIGTRSREIFLDSIVE
ncbi:MAG: DNA translocase FtsK 4TM domain-containing protein [Myxococcota bacterium]